MRRGWIVIGIVLLAGLAIGAVACGGGTKSTSTPTSEMTAVSTRAATAATTPSGTTTGETAVEVNLLEYKIVPNMTSVPAGTVTFDAKNIGATEHELVVLKTDLGPTALPTKADGSADEEGAGISNVDEIESLEAGGTRSLTVNLDAGHYLLVCNVILQTNGQAVSHYAQGMAVEFTVTP